MISDANKAVNDLASIVPLLGGSSRLKRPHACGAGKTGPRSRAARISSPRFPCLLPAVFLLLLPAVSPLVNPLRP
ncbi:putative DNA-binding protein [Klebsiella pneumoniae]|uniref:Putative DNA-binding protein n=1 Tax=Klebsiella pneumoniae TaxID=573 RepID=A0A2X1Q3S5_KLEPN|nr:putative DNA-binding protein [Klebsiella pneumoniae]STR95132.1 putative DNA-binding protein [Klebsiella pneumoniae]SUY94948.1 putative DNA-binding protein [Klebsiella pneumoniae]